MLKIKNEDCPLVNLKILGIIPYWQNKKDLQKILLEIWMINEWKWGILNLMREEDFSFWENLTWKMKIIVTW